MKLSARTLLALCPFALVGAISPSAGAWPIQAEGGCPEQPLVTEPPPAPCEPPVMEAPCAAPIEIPPPPALCMPPIEIARPPRLEINAQLVPCTRLVPRLQVQTTMEPVTTLVPDVQAQLIPQAPLVFQLGQGFGELQQPEPSMEGQPPLTEEPPAEGQPEMQGPPEQEGPPPEQPQIQEPTCPGVPQAGEQLGPQTGEQAGPQPMQGQLPQQEKSATAEPQGHGHVALMRAALEQVNLKPEQACAVSKVLAVAEKNQAVVNTAKKALLLGLADQLESGAVDRCALSAQIDAVAAARDSTSAANRAGLKALHEVLDAEQRTQFADALSSAIGERMEKYTSGGWFDTWGEDLNLSPEQKQSIQAVFDQQAQERTAAREKGAKMLDAFKADKFDPDKIAPAGEAGKHSRERAKRMLSAAEAIAKILTAEQRTLAAEKIRDDANKL